jgi:hypothetical protein
MKDLELDGGRGVAMNDGRTGDWMQTWTGRRFYPADPRPEDLDIVDIAHALAHVSRYGGHCQFYSVAEHSVLVSEMVPPEHALAGLLHDAPEAYIADVIRPVKRILTRSNLYFSLEAGIWDAIAKRFSLAPDLPESVKLADTAICMIEQRALHPRATAWDFAGIPPPKGVRIACREPRAALILFLRRFCDLTDMPLQERLELQQRVVRLHEQDDHQLRDTSGGLHELVHELA